MENLKKSEYLQIRVSKHEKSLIKAYAQSAGIDMSAWVLQTILNNKTKEFNQIINKFTTEKQSFVFAELHDFLYNLNAKDFALALSRHPNSKLSSFQINYIIAMIDYRAKQLKVLAPNWIKHYPILEEPYFGSDLKSLRLHLLINSPIAFKQRNIYIDSSIGDRV